MTLTEKANRKVAYRVETPRLVLRCWVKICCCRGWGPVGWKSATGRMLTAAAVSVPW